MAKYTNQELNEVIKAVVNEAVEEGIFSKIFSNETMGNAEEMVEKANSIFREQHMNFAAKADKRVGGAFGIMLYDLETRKGVAYINYNPGDQIYGYGVLGTTKYTSTAKTMATAIEHAIGGYLQVRQQRKVAESRIMNEGESYGWVVESDEAQEAYDLAVQHMGKEYVDDAIVGALGYEKLADILAYLFRMWDFREWDNRNSEEEEDDEDDFDEGEDW